MKRSKRRQQSLPARPAEIAAWARDTRERLRALERETFETVARAMYEEANTGAPFEVPIEKIAALLQLWIRQGGAHDDVEKFYPKTAARIRGLLARETRKKR